MRFFFGTSFNQTLSRLVVYTSSVLFAVPSYAAMTAAAGINYTGRIMSADGVTPVTSPAVAFSVAIYDINHSCLLYDESRTLNLSTTAGTFSFNIADGTATSQNFYGDVANINDIFSNGKTFNLPNCASPHTGFTPVANEPRVLMVSFDAGDGSGAQNLPALKINPVPSALQAYKVNGYGTGDLLRIDSTVDKTANANTDLSQTQYDEFWRLVKNPGTAYLSSSTALGGDVTGAFATNTVVKIQNQAVSATAPTTGQILVFNGTAWTPTTPAPSGVASVTASLPLSVSGTSTANITISQAGVASDGFLSQADWNTFNSKQTSLLANGKILVGNASGVAAEVAMSGDAMIDNAGVLTLANSGVTAGSYSKVTVDAKGRVTIGDNLLSADIISMLGYTPVNKAGDVMSGNLSLVSVASDPAGLVAGDEGKMWYRSDLNTIRYWDGSAAVSLGVAGAGITSLNGLSVGGQNFVTGTAGADFSISSSGTDHTFNIPTASAVNRGALSSADWSAFNAKQSANLNSAQIWVGNSGNVAAAVTMTGDASIDNAGALSIGAGKITAPMLSSGGVLTATSGVVIAGTTGNIVNFACSTSGHVLKWSVTGWTCAFADPSLPTLADGKVWIGNSGNAATAVSFSGDASVDNAGVVTLANSGATAGTYTKVTVDAKGRVTSGGALASADVTTALGYTPSSVATAFVQNGNSFGATAVLGTNDAQDLALETNNAARMTITSGGSVGVGTAAPATSLDVRSTTYQQMRLQNGSSQQLWSGAVADTIGSFIGGNAYYNTSYQFIPNYTSASGINFRQDGSTEFWNDTGLTNGTSYVPTKRMTILNTGDVGIGTVAPTARLETTGGQIKMTGPNGNILSSSARVGGFATVDQVQIGPYLIVDSYQAEGGNNLKFRNVIGGYTFLPSDHATLKGNLSVVDASNNYRLYIDQAAGGNVLINSNGIGNVGIGTATPQALLHAATGVSDFRFSQGNSNLTPTMQVINTNAGGKAAALLAGTNGAGFIYDSAGTFQIQSDVKANFTGNTLGAGTPRFLIDSAGNVGIGTVSPSSILDISGAQTIRETAAAAAPAPTAGKAFLYADDSSHTLKASLNGGAYGDLVTTSSVSAAYVAKAGDTMTGALITSAGSAAAPAVGVGGTNLGLFNAGSNALGVSTSGAERMRFDSAGNVGIGTSSPAGKLDVSGGNNEYFYFRGQSGNPSIRLTKIDSAEEFLIRKQAGGTSFEHNLGGNQMYLSSNGKIGIGTTNPLGALHVNIGSGEPSLYLENTSTNAPYLQFAQGGFIQSQDSNGSLRMRVPAGAGFISLDTNGANERVRIDSVGSVGIGTSNPGTSSVLDISSTTKGVLIPRMTAAQRDAIASPATGLQVYNIDTNLLNFFNGTSWAAISVGSSMTGATSATKTELGNGASASGTNGTAIGTSTSVSGTNAVAIGNSASANGTNGVAIGNSASVTGTNAIAIGNGVSVSNNDEARLGTSGAYLSGSGVWTNASDRRLKKDIIDLNYGLSEVLQLRPVHYTSIRDNSHHVGFIAQEVREVIPEAVSGKEGDLKKGENLGLEYSNLTSVLVNAIKELYAKFLSQEARVADLESELAAKNREIQSVKSELEQQKLRMDKLEKSLQGK